MDQDNLDQDNCFNPFASESTNSEEITDKVTNGWTLYGAQKQTGSVESSSILDKYRPTTSKDIFGNKSNIKYLKKWIKNKMEPKGDDSECLYDYAFVTGESGVGKSEFVRVCFAETGYSLIEYDQAINKAELEVIKESITFSSIEQLLSGEKRKGIVVDNFVDNLSTTQLTELLKLLKKESKISSPTVFITSSTTKLGDVFKGNVLHIDFEEPSKNDVLSLCKKICRNEKIKMSQGALDQYLENSSEIYSVRDLLSTMVMFGYKDSKITLQNMDELQKITAKDLELGIQATLNIFVNPDVNYAKNTEGVSDGFDNVRMASMYTSSLIHENYLNIVKRDTSMEDLSEIADSIVSGNIYKHAMLSNQLWDLSEYIGIFGTFAPGIIIKKNYKPIKTMKINSKIIYDIRGECSFGLSSDDIKFAISNILFPLRPEEKWIRNMKESSRIFYKFMKYNHVDMARAIKYIDQSYCLSPDNHDKATLRKIKTKFRTEWKLLM